MVYYTCIERASRREKSRIERRVAGLLLKWVAEQSLPGGAKALDALMRIGPHGKPYLEGHPAYFNLSHSGGMVVCAWEHCEVGVDVEKKRVFTKKLEERICTPGECSLIEGEPIREDALTQLWTMKESYMKYTGLGFAQGILSTEFTELGERPRLKTGDAFFSSVQLTDVYVTLCSEVPVKLHLEEVSANSLLG